MSQRFWVNAEKEAERKKAKKKGAIFILPDACKCLCLKMFFFLNFVKAPQSCFPDERTYLS